MVIAKNLILNLYSGYTNEMFKNNMRIILQTSLLLYSIAITLLYVKFSLNYTIPETVTERPKPTKYVTYDRYGGRFNNQLFAMASAAATAKMLGRTLVLPVEKRSVDWTGIFDNVETIWDLKNVEEEFDIIRSHEYSRFGIKIPKECVIDIRKIYQDKSLGEECEIISLGGGTRPLYCKKQLFCGAASYQRMAYEFYHSLKLVPRLQKIVDAYPVYKLGLHSRSFLGSGNKAMCPSKSKEVIRHHLTGSDNKIEEMVKLICTTRDKDNFKKLAKMYNHTVNKNMVYAIDYPEYNVMGGHKFERFDTGQSNLGIKFWGYSPKIKDMDNIVQILLEQRILAKTSFFFGNVFSTLSLTICILRGEEKRWSSNVCGLLLHPDLDRISSIDYWNSVIYKS